MPRRDGTGPLGQGPGSGRGLGRCGRASVGFAGRGLGRGFGRRFGKVQNLTKEEQLQELQEEETYLKEELEKVSAEKKSLEQGQD